MQQQEHIFLRARGYLVAGIVTKTAGEGFAQTGLSYIETALKAIPHDESEVVQVACVRALQDFLPALPSASTKQFQFPIITTLSDYLASHDLREMLDSDDLKFTLVDTLRITIIVDPSIVLSSIALDVLFNIASNGATNFQLTMMVTETFEDVVQYISGEGPNAYIRLCEKVLPSLTGAIDVGNITQESSLTSLATDLIRALVEHALEPLPQGFVATIMPKLNRLLLSSGESDLLPSATLAVRYMLAHDPNQFLSWQDPQTGKGAVETVLIIIDHLLGRSVDDHAATEVGGLAAELVEKAGAEKLGPYLSQLLSAVAHRLATAHKAQFIQSLILVFARLSLISAHEVVDFLANQSIAGGGGDQQPSALNIVLSKWLENSVNFAGYEEIRQNVIALSKIYQLDDPRVAQVQVKGDLIVQDTGRIKTRSQARNNPDQYTIIPAPLKIIKVLVEELSASGGGGGSGHDLDPATASAAFNNNANGDSDDGGDDGDFDDDDDDDWEDIPSSSGGGAGAGNILDLNLGITKQELMGFAAEGDGGDIIDGSSPFTSSRRRDDETQATLAQFFREVALKKPEFREQFAALTPAEQERLRSLE